MHEKYYRIDTLDVLQPCEMSAVRWLSPADDFVLFRDHLALHGYVLSQETWQTWEVQGISYCGLMRSGHMVAKAAVERYSQTMWETADIRVLPEVRGQGYGICVVTFITTYILSQQRIASCRTRSDNFAMQRVLAAVGFREVDAL